MTIRDESPVDLNISVSMVHEIILHARAYDVKVAPGSSSDGSNPIDDDEMRILESRRDDYTGPELRAVINGLNDSEAVDLIALAWVGRGDFDRASFEEARSLAVERHGDQNADYLMGMPLLGDYLEEGLSELGHPVTEERD
jgi:hypothetical protein